MSNIFEGVSDAVKSLMNLPGNIAKQVADILPSDGSHSDMKKYAKDKGGTMERNLVRMPGLIISPEDHSAMMDNMNGSVGDVPTPGSSKFINSYKQNMSGSED